MPTGVTFHWDTLQRKGKRGDNWCMTWASDDNLYTMMDDGIGWNEDGVEWGTKFLQISGDESFDGSDVKEVEGWPYNPLAGSFYGYGTYSVDGRIYVWLWKSEGDRFYSRPIANRLLYTDDHGQTFYRWDGTELTADNFADTDPESFFATWCNHCTRPSTVGMWHSRNPWGPWKRFYCRAGWQTPGDPPEEWGFDGAASRTYQFKLNPKWVYDDGRTMYLIWSDAGGRWDDDHFGHSSNCCRWNQVKNHPRAGAG